MLREKGVVGKFVEFYGEGLARLPLADRATISNMAPEQGATCVMFPIDDETLNYLRLTGRPEEQIALVEAYAREQGMFHDPSSEPAVYSDNARARPRRRRAEPRGPAPAAGPRAAARRQGVVRARARERCSTAADPPNKPNGASLSRFAEEGGHTAVGVEEQSPTAVEVRANGNAYSLDHGSVVIAAITSCTNTSNPVVMVGAGLLAKQRGRARADAAAVGEDEPRARARRS